VGTNLLQAGDALGELAEQNTTGLAALLTLLTDVLGGRPRRRHAIGLQDVGRSLFDS